MNFKKLSAALVGMVMAVSFNANAGLIEADYLTGDNGAVLDTASNLVWLDLNFTRGYTKALALSSYTDFRLATKAEYDLMFTSWFSAFNNYNIASDNIISILASDIDLVRGWGNLFGQTTTRTDRNTSTGIIEAQNPTTFFWGGAEFVGVSPSQIVRIYPNYISTSNFTSSKSTGWFMVKAAQNNNSTSVPEPSTLAIFALGIIGLASRRSLLVNKKQ